MIIELAIIGGVILLIALFFISQAFRVFVYILLGLVVIAVFFKFFVKKYSEFERAIIFRLGKFNRIVGPGWSIVAPFFEKEFSKVDVRTRMMNLDVPMAFTRDDLRIKLNGLFYYKINDPEKALLKIEDYRRGLNSMVQSETRNLIAGMGMRELFGNLSNINELLKDKIRTETWKWGIDVTMLQIAGITPPEEIIEAMQAKEIAAQQLQAQKFNAEARKVAIEAIGEAAKSLDDFSIMYLYLEALKELSKGQATKIIFPMQFINVLKDMREDVGKAMAGLNITGMVNAMKDKILEAGS